MHPRTVLGAEALDRAAAVHGGKSRRPQAVVAAGGLRLLWASMPTLCWPAWEILCCISSLDPNHR